MADTKISDYTAAPAYAAGDLLEMVDISDTTMGAGGSNRKTTIAALLAVRSPLTVAAVNSPKTIGADYSCDGVDDEVEINSAINALAVAVSNEAITAGPHILANACDSTSGWSALGSATLAADTGVKKFGSASLKVTASASATDPGAQIGSLSITGTNYDYIDMWVFGPAQGIKLKITLTTADGSSVYETRPHSYGEWSHVRVPLLSPYSQTGTLGTITTIGIRAHIGESSTFPPATFIYYVDAVGFSSRQSLAYSHVRPGTPVLTTVGGGTTYTIDTDYHLDYASGEITMQPGGAISSGASLEIDYSRGGGTVVLLPGDYRISATSIKLKSWVTLFGDDSATLHRQSGAWAENDALIKNSDTAQRLYGAEVRGCTIIGYRDDLAANKGVRGISLLNTEDVVIAGNRIRDTGNAAILIGPVGTEYAMRPVVRNNLVERCGGEWVDIPGGVYQALASTFGAYSAALRMERCRQWECSGNAVIHALGDATHFLTCHDGRAADNRIINARMGGWFCEGGERNVATGNLVTYSGSRGVTIERDAFHWTFTGNTVSYSGRENIWVNGASYNSIVGNTLVNGGNLKMSGGTAGDFANWNIRISATEGSYVNSSYNHVVGNTIITDSNYATAAIRIAADAGATIAQNVVEGNILHGTQKTISNLQSSSLIAQPALASTPTVPVYRQVINGDGAVLEDYDAAIMEMRNASNSNPAPFSVYCQAGSSATNGAYMQLAKCRGTFAAPTSLSSGDRIAAFLAKGYNSSLTPAWVNTAVISFYARAVGASSNAGEIRMEVAQSASTTRLNRARFSDQAAYLLLEAAAPADGDLANSECVIYRSSGTLRAKFKDSVGTVADVLLG